MEPAISRFLASLVMTTPKNASISRAAFPPKSANMCTRLGSFAPGDPSCHSTRQRRLFFSYCRDDSEFAIRLAEDLKAAGAGVWIDQLDIEPGMPWDRVVENAVTSCPRMLVILSPVSVNSDVRDEVCRTYLINRLASGRGAAASLRAGSSAGTEVLAKDARQTNKDAVMLSERSLPWQGSSFCHPERSRAGFARLSRRTPIAAQDCPWKVVLTGFRYQARLKSFHSGLLFSMSAVFLSRLQPFNCFSRAIAVATWP